ncbi:MAG: TetR/AcrR family transcriptional regulator [Acidobacteria bacterium]|nr:TetR/AcrR family transcriptional regulator [Acidobacteriota bacterium]
MHSAERRAAILGEAVRLFAERGFRGTTTRELAAAVGVSEPVLYEHFRTKRELYEAIVELKAGEGHERFSQLIAAHEDGDDDQVFFENLAEKVLEFYASNPDYVRLLMFSALESHEAGEIFHLRHREAVLRPLSGYIERRMRQGAIRKGDAVVAARAFIGLVAHFGLYGVLFPGSLPKMERKDLARELVKTFLRGAAADAKPRKQKR